MGLFGKSFEEKVQEAVEQVRAKVGASSLAAKIDGKTVTLVGAVDSADTKGRVMAEFNALVETDNTLNQVRIEAPEPAPAAEAPAPQETAAAPAGIGGPGPERIHEVVSGDTLGAIAQRYYGKASLYPKIFDANRDQLDDPDKIQVGQQLRIPE